MNSIIKLTSGETLVAEVVHEDERHVSILEPMLLEIGESEETGQPMLVALSWVPLTKQVNLVNLKTPHVITVIECDDEISDYYEKSLAILKRDKRKLREIIEKETGISDMKEVHRRLKEADEGMVDLDDQWTEKFGTPSEAPVNSANTVH
ncbi:MAG: hypothetical protein VW270_11340 [Candidatus Poseidoniales archaeon]